MSSLAYSGIKKEHQQCFLDDWLDQQSEEEYDFLNAKPELGRKLGKKGRRHAGEMLLSKKVATNAYLIKSAVLEKGDGTVVGAIGKKRRARLLSEHESDFKLNVPYSLNRKCRWDVRDVALNSAGSDILQTPQKTATAKTSVVVVEADFTLKENGFPNKAPLSLTGVKACHEVSPTGEVVSHYSKSKRGANCIKGLLTPPDSPPTEQEKRETLDKEPAEPLGQVDLNVHYRYLISKPHPVLATRAVFKGKLPKLPPNRRGGLWQDTPIRLSKQQQQQQTALQGRALEHGLASEELLHSYSPPRGRVYSLADFVVRGTAAKPVILRNRSLLSLADSVEEVGKIASSFDFLNNAEGEETEAQAPEDGEESEAQLTAPPTHSAVKRHLDEVCAGKKWVFDVVKCPAASIGVRNRQQWLEQCAELGADGRYKVVWWADSSHSRLFIDLSDRLAEAACKPKPIEPQLVCAVGYLDASEEIHLLVNAAFEVDDSSAMLSSLTRIQCANLAGLLEWSVEKMQASFKRSLAENSDGMLVQTLNYNYASQHNSPLFCARCRPADGYWALPNCEALRPEKEKASIEAESADEEEELDENFEIIGADGEVLSESPPRLPSPEIEVVGTVCDVCHTEVAEFPCTIACGHQLCEKCLGYELSSRLSKATSGLGGNLLQCMLHGCGSEMNVASLVQLVLPLPLANLYTLFTQLQGAGEVPLCLERCLGCAQYVVATEPNKATGLRQISCSQCRIQWCCFCKAPAHWPLGCEQNAEWSAKFEEQYRIGDSADPKPRNGQLGAIAQQYFVVCAESHSRRFDERLNHQITGHLRRVTGTASHQLSDMRMAALHLLEYGYAWLYTTKGIQRVRPKHWSVIKARLTELRRRTEWMESELLFSGSLTKPDELQGKMEGIRLLIEQVVEKFHST